jgi:hypothetical protein
MYTNKTNIPLPFAIWLAADQGYDLTFNPTVVTATEILRSMRSIILSRQLAAEKAKDEVVTRDIEEKAASSLGTAVHSSVEHAWRAHYQLAMKNLGYGSELIDKVAISPKKPKEGDLNIYFERRTSKQIEGFTLSGKFDMVMDGTVRDIKTTKAYTYMKGSQDNKYRMQGSIYRWLNPDIITNDTMMVDYYFTDWNPVTYKRDKEKNYPPARMLEKSFILLSAEDTEQFIRDRLQEIKHYTGRDQNQLPLCTPEELWQNPSQWEYWSKPTNQKCSKLFKTREEADTWLISKGVGFIQERQNEPTFCKYCDAQTICKQAQQYITAGILNL